VSGDPPVETITVSGRDDYVYVSRPESLAEVERLVPLNDKITLACLEQVDTAAELIKQRGAVAVIVVVISPGKQLATLVKGGTVDLLACAGAAQAAATIAYTDSTEPLADGEDE
jgi:hypothetical protein